MLTINNTLDGYLKDVEIKGNTIQDASNLADIRSVGDKVEGQELYEIPVLSVGKNLFDGNIIKGFIGNNGILDTNATDKDFRSDKYILCKPNTNYKGAYYTTEGARVTSLTLHYFDKNYKKISQKIGYENTLSPENAKYIMPSLYSSNSVKGVVIVENEDSPSQYEPYQEDKLTILSPTPLEKVGNVRDRIIEKDGVLGVEKNVATKIFNETFNYSRTQLNLAGLESYTCFGTPIDGCATTRENGCILSDKFVWAKGESVNSIEVLGRVVSIHSNGNIYFRLYNSDLEADSIDGFKKWISNNNVLVKYATTNPTFIPLPHDQQVKLRTFANKTNISFLTEIEGTIKAQVPKSLGATVNTHTTQINNLNKELDRVKKLEESTVSTVTTESDFTTVEATSNGYFEDVKLEGKTLVNIAPNKISIPPGSLKEVCVVPLIPMKPNFNYTIKVFNVPSVATNCTISFRTNDWKDRIKHLDSEMKVLYTTPSQVEVDNLKYILLNIGADVTSEQLKEIRFLILEGDHTQNPPSFFEGLKSVGDGVDEISVESVKGDGNLLMPLHTGVATGSYNKNNITFSSDYSMSYVANAWGQGLSVDVVGIVKGETYVVLCDTNTNMCIRGTNALNTTSDISMYSNKAEIVATSTGIGTIEFKNATETGNISCTNLRVIKKGSKEEFSVLNQDKKRLLYYNNETQTWEKPVLREWDSIEKHSNGKYYYYQRSGEVVLNGSEDWNNDKNSSTISPATYRQSIRFDAINMPNSAFNTQTSPNIISDLLPTVIFSDVYSYNHIGISISDTDSIGTHIIINNNFIDVTELKQWLQANNLTVVYQLAEEKVYECTNIDLITYANETNYIVESGAIVPRSTLKVHNNISNVVSLLQKKVSILDDKVTGILINAQIAEDETSIVGNKLNLTTDKYQVTNMVNNTQIVLPAVDKFTEIHLFFDTTSDMTLVYPSVKWQTVPTIKANASYEFIFTYVNDAWLGGYIVRK